MHPQALLAIVVNDNQQKRMIYCGATHVQWGATYNNHDFGIVVYRYCAITILISHVMLIKMVSLFVGFLNFPRNQDIEMANNGLMGMVCLSNILVNFSYWPSPLSQLGYCLPLHV